MKLKIQSLTWPQALLLIATIFLSSHSLNVLAGSYPGNGSGCTGAAAKVIFDISKIDPLQVTFKEHTYRSGLGEIVAFYVEDTIKEASHRWEVELSTNDCRVLNINRIEI